MTNYIPPEMKERYEEARRLIESSNNRNLKKDRQRIRKGF